MAKTFIMKLFSRVWKTTWLRETVKKGGKKIEVTHVVNKLDGVIETFFPFAKT